MTPYKIIIIFSEMDKYFSAYSKLFKLFTKTKLDYYHI